MPFAVNVRLQLSFYLPQISKIEYVWFVRKKIVRNIFSSLFKSVKPILVPIVWFDDEARLHSDVHSELSTLVVSLNTVYYIKYILLSVSLLTLLMSAVYIFVQVRLNFFVLLACFSWKFLWTCSSGEMLDMNEWIPMHLYLVERSKPDYNPFHFSFCLMFPRSTSSSTFFFWFWKTNYFVVPFDIWCLTSSQGFMLLFSFVHSFIHFING